MNDITVGRDHWVTEFSASPIAADLVAVLDGVAALTVRSGAATIQTYVKTVQLRALAHMLVCAADKIDIVPEVAE
jgi:hypothetical protein